VHAIRRVASELKPGFGPPSSPVLNAAFHRSSSFERIRGARPDRRRRASPQPPAEGGRVKDESWFVMLCILVCFVFGLLEADALTAIHITTVRDRLEKLETTHTQAQHP
jgi:hypothetical protein